MIVEKFGGSCLKGPADYRRMVGIIKSAEANEPKLVLSAVRGVTDELVRQASLAKSGQFDLSGVSSTHLGLVEALRGEARTDAVSQVEMLLDELEDRMTRVANQRQLTLPALDDVVVYGEKLAIAIALGYLAEGGLQARPLSGRDAGIVTDGVYGNASILEESRVTVRSRLEPVHLPLVAGFFGVDKAGNITTLGRGSSDYVATFIAAALGCRVVLFKDVDGVMTADPKVVPHAKLIPRLGYEAALEMARYGSKVLFEKAVMQASRAGVQIEVRSFDRPDEGTMVMEGGEGEGVSHTKSLSLVDASHFNSFKKASAVISTLDEAYGWSPPVLASMFRDGLVIVIDDSQVGVVSAAAAAAGVGEVDVRRAVSVVALTGKRFNVSGAADAIRKAKVEPLGVFRTPSGISTCVLVDAVDTEITVNALHGLLRIDAIEG